VLFVTSHLLRNIPNNSFKFVYSLINTFLIRTDPPGEEGGREGLLELDTLDLGSDPNPALTVDKILASLDLYFDWRNSRR
jgi:hypothetical protein